MTESRGVGRGGKRPKAGRPRKTEIDHDDLCSMAYRILEQIMGDPSLPPAPRVTAAKAVIARSTGGAAGGKKDAAHRAAAMAGAGTDWGDDLDSGRVN